MKRTETIVKAICRKILLVAALVGTLAAATAQAQTAPKMKMTTDIPPEITTPDSVETRLGTLKFFDGFPDKATVEKVYDNLDFQRGVQAFLTCVPGASQVPFATGFAALAPTTRRSSSSSP